MFFQMKPSKLANRDHSNERIIRNRRETCTPCIKRREQKTERERKKKKEGMFSARLGYIERRKKRRKKKKEKKTALTFGYVEADSFLLPGGERGLQGLGHLLVGPRC